MPTAKAGRPPGRQAAPDAEGRRRLRELRQELLAYYPGPMPRSRLALMDVTPSKLHVYWSIDAEYLAGLRRRHRTPAAPLMLRLYELNGRAEPHRHLDFELDGLTHNRYIDLWAEGRAYLGQLGLKTRRRFISVATSAPVRMPEAGPAPAPPPPETSEEERGRVNEIEAEREALIRHRYCELAERAVAGGPEGLEAGRSAGEGPGPVEMRHEVPAPRPAQPAAPPATEPFTSSQAGEPPRSFARPLSTREWRAGSSLELALGRKGK